VVVVAYGQILPPEVLALPPLGCVNVHASLLPRWRGAAPIARAIEAGDTQTGVCLMQMDAGLDTGPVLAEAAWPIAPGTTAAEAHDALADLGARLLVERLPLLAAGGLPARPQPAEGASYARKLRKEEAGLDWRQPAVVLARRVCAFNPAPVAWSTLAGERLRIWRAQAMAAPADALPGTVLAADADGLQIATGDGRLRITELQRPGGRRLPAAEALRGWNPLGRRFD
jgi:methionyl-tRNA formyltransferase (EC 2.1.2.9)